MNLMSKKRNTWFAVSLGTFLLIASLLLDPNENYIYFRGLRALLAFSFMILLYITRKEKENVLVIWFMLFHGLSSTLTLWYEQDVIATFSIVINSLAFILLIFAIHSKLKIRRLDKLILIAIIISAIIIAWLSASFVQLLSDYILYTPLIVAIAGLTFIVYVLALYAFVYLNVANTGSSILFVFFLILISFAETFRGIGYYEIVDSVLGQLTARVLLILSYVFLYLFGVHVNRQSVNSFRV